MNDTGERAAMTIRPPASAELLIDSLDRYTTGVPAWNQETTSSDWRTNFQQNILYGYFTRLAITQIQFFWNLPTILEGYNNQFSVTVVGPGAGTYLITLQEGFFTPEELAQNIQAALILLTGVATFTCVFVPRLRSFNIAVGGGNTFTIDVPTDNIQNRTLITCGLSPDVVAGNDIFYGVPTMLATRFIDIVSNYLTKYQRVKDSTTLKNPTVSNVIARVYPCAPNTRSPLLAASALRDGDSLGSSPFVLCIDYGTPKHIKWSPDEAISNFDLRLLDDFGDLVPWSMAFGCEYQLTLLASES